MSAAVAVGGCPPAVRVRLSALKNDIIRDLSGGRFVCARSKEWAALSADLRMGILLLAGVDGDLKMLADRGWREFSPPEREALRGVVRMMSKAMSASPALSARWGDDG